MTVVRHPSLRLNDTAFPIYNPSAATLAFAALPNRKRWLEGDAGFISDPGTGLKWYDRMTAEPCAVTGLLGGGGDALTARSGALFTGTQTVNLGNIFPTAGDYNVFAVYRQTAGVVGNGGGMGLVSSASADGASYRSVHLSYGGAGTGRPAVVHAGQSMWSSTTDRAAGTLNRLHAAWTETPKARAVMVNDAADTNNAVAALVSNALSSAVVGSIGNLAASYNFVGTIYHVSIFGALTSAQQAAARAYLAEQYGS